jgi:hypothetical protein
MVQQEIVIPVWAADHYSCIYVINPSGVSKDSLKLCAIYFLDSLPGEYCSGWWHMNQ